MDTDADRLEMIKSLGGRLVRTDAGVVYALYDAEGTPVDFEGARGNSTAPQITARTADVLRLGINLRGASVTIDDREYTVREHLPDGTGLSIVILDDE